MVSSPSEMNNTTNRLYYRCLLFNEIHVHDFCLPSILLTQHQKLDHTLAGINRNESLESRIASSSPEGAALLTNLFYSFFMRSSLALQHTSAVPQHNHSPAVYSPSVADNKDESCCWSAYAPFVCTISIKGTVCRQILPHSILNLTQARLIAFLHPADTKSCPQQTVKSRSSFV